MRTRELGEPASYRRRLGRLDGLLWEAAERLDDLVVEGRWPPPTERLSEMAGVLVILAVGLDEIAASAKSADPNLSDTRQAARGPVVPGA